MKKKEKKQTIILVVVLAVLAVSYYFKDSIIAMFGGGGSADVSGGVDNIPDTTNPDTPIENYLTTVVKVGSTGEAVKRVQQRINKLIDLCKEQFKGSDTPFHVSDSVFERSRFISEMSKLNDDGSFGEKTRVAVKYIMNTNSTTLEKVRGKYKDFENAFK